MSYKIIILSLIFVIYCAVNLAGKWRFKILTLLFCIILSGIPLFSIGQMGSAYDRLGGFGADLFLFPSTFIALYILSKPHVYRVAVHRWVALALLLLVLANMINPYNIYPKAAVVFIFVLFQILLILYAIKSRYDNEQIFVALYEASLCWLTFEAVLTLCYPLLGMNSVLTFFHGDVASQWAMRREGYPSAVGSYFHPAALAFVTALSFFVYFVAYLKKYKVKVSRLAAVVCLFVIFFTFSRTTYLSILVASMTLLLSFRGVKFNYKFILYVLLFVGLSYGAVQYIPALNSMFFQSDANMQFDSRMIHWQLGSEMWISHFWMGVGINTHVHYMLQSTFASIKDVAEFFYSNPIHNVHIQVLAETGIIGMCLWLGLFLWQVIKSYISASVNRLDTKAALLRLSVLLFVFIYSNFGWVLLDYSVLFPTVLTAFSLSITPKVKYIAR